METLSREVSVDATYAPNYAKLVSDFIYAVDCDVSKFRPIPFSEYQFYLTELASIDTFMDTMHITDAPTRSDLIALVGAVRDIFEEHVMAESFACPFTAAAVSIFACMARLYTRRSVVLSSMY